MRPDARCPSEPHSGCFAIQGPGSRGGPARRGIKTTEGFGQLRANPCLLDTLALARYEEDHHNCYSYALAFINCILATEGEEQLDRDEFTEKFVVPRTRKASKYITLYRAIEERGFYVTDPPSPQTGPRPGSGLC